MINKALAELNERLITQKNTPNPELAKLLSEQEKTDTFDFLLSQETQEKINKMKTGDGLVFRKNEKLRKIVIIYTGKEYIAILDHKRKKSGGIKDMNALVIGGSFKRGKHARRLDRDMLYFSAVEKIRIQGESISAEKEALYSQRLNPEYVTTTYCVPEKDNESKKPSSRSFYYVEEKSTFYSECAKENLSQYFEERKKNQSSKSGAEVTLKNQLTVQELDMVLHLLKGLKSIHDERIAHNDIRSDNILVFDEGGRLIPKFTDLGLIIDGNLQENNNRNLDVALKKDIENIGSIILKFMFPEQKYGLTAKIEWLKKNPDLSFVARFFPPRDPDEVDDRISLAEAIDIFEKYSNSIVATLKETILPDVIKDTFKTPLPDIISGTITQNSIKKSKSHIVSDALSEKNSVLNNVDKKRPQRPVMPIWMVQKYKKKPDPPPKPTSLNATPERPKKR